MWGTVGWEGTSQGTGLLITGLSNIISQVTAADLQNGTAHVGPVWTKVGSVAFNGADSPRASVGPFVPGTSYYTLPTGNVIDQVQNLTIVAVLRNPGGNILLGTGTGTTTGFYMGAASTVGINLPANGVVTSDSLAASGLVVAFAGWNNGTTTEYAKVGGGNTAASAVAGPLAQDPGTTTLGQRRDGFGYTGYLYELAISTNVPSDAAFVAIYNQIKLNALT